MIDAVAENDPLQTLDILVQSLKAIELSHLQRNWTQAGQLELVKTGDVPARAQSRPAGGPHRLVAPAGSEENAPVGGANVVAGGSDRRGRSRSRGEGADGTNDKPSNNRPKDRGAKGKGKGKKGKARWK